MRRSIGNHDKHPAFREKVERDRKTHEDTQGKNKWLGQKTVDLQQRLNSGDHTVETRDVIMQLQSDLTFLMHTQHADIQQSETVGRFLDASAFHLLANVSSLHPNTRKYLENNDYIKADGNLSPFKSFTELAQDVAILAEKPHELYVDVLRLRLENATEHTREYEVLAGELRDEFMDELPSVIARLNLPIDINTAVERIQNINFQVIDPLVNVPAGAIHGRYHGYYLFDDNVVGIDFDIFTRGREYVKSTITHELYHAISGHSVVIDDSSKISAQRVGTRITPVESTNTFRERLWWLNEAITETLTQQHMQIVNIQYPKDSYYRDEISVMQTLLDTASDKEAAWLVILEAYFENAKEKSDTKQHTEQQPALRAFIRYVREEFGDGALVYLDDLMGINRFEMAKKFIRNPHRNEIREVRKVAYEQLYKSWQIKEIERYGDDALAMLSQHKEPKAEVVARAIEAAIMLYAENIDAEHVPKRLMHVIGQILDKYEAGGLIYNKLVRSQLAQLDTILPKNGTHEDPFTNRVQRLVDLAFLARKVTNKNLSEQVEDVLTENALPSWLISKRFDNATHSFAGSTKEEVQALHRNLLDKFHRLGRKHPVFLLLIE